MSNFLEHLKQVIPEESIRLNEPMKNHTTFRIGGNADYFVSVNREQLPQILAIAKGDEVSVTIIGNGSNLLVKDGGIRGLVVEIGKDMEEIQIHGNCITAGAGALLSKIARAAADAGLSGLEFASGIPGSLGGAVVMNAGAYGGEMKQVLVSAKVLDKNGEEKILSNEELDLSYRHSCIEEKGYIVVEATIRLNPKEKEQIFAEMEDIRKRRLEKQPLEFPSAGSTFKRPEGYFAGKLIQDSGLSGYSVGGAQVSEKHNGFVINKGNATAQDVLTLIENVKKEVYRQFQVELVPEVKIIGE
ncbi:MAG: UDP-N-acetylmuramate dehydrogenase [Agathobacter sp.]